MENFLCLVKTSLNNLDKVFLSSLNKFKVTFPVQFLIQITLKTKIISIKNANKRMSALNIYFISLSALVAFQMSSSPTNAILIMLLFSEIQRCKTIMVRMQPERMFPRL